MGCVVANEPMRDDHGADRRGLGAEAVVERFKGLPAVDPDRLQADVDAIIDQRPGGRTTD